MRPLFEEPLLRPLEDAEALARLVLQPEFPKALRPTAAALLQGMFWPRSISPQLLDAAWTLGVGPALEEHATAYGGSELALAQSSRAPGTLRRLAEGVTVRSRRVLPSLLLCNRHLPEDLVPPLVRLLLDRGPELPPATPSSALLLQRLEATVGPPLRQVAADLGWSEPPLALLCSPRARIDLPALCAGQSGEGDRARRLAALRRDLTDASRARCRARWARLEASGPPEEDAAVPAAAAALPLMPASAGPLPTLAEAHRLSSAHAPSSVLDGFAVRLLQHPDRLLRLLHDHQQVSDRLLAALLRSSARVGAPPLPPLQLLGGLGPDGLAGLLRRLRRLPVRWSPADRQAGRPHAVRLLRQDGSDLTWLQQATGPDGLLHPQAASCLLHLGPQVLAELTEVRRFEVICAAFAADPGLLAALPRIAQILRPDGPHLLLPLPVRVGRLEPPQATDLAWLLRLSGVLGRPDPSVKVDRLLDRLLAPGPLRPPARWTLVFFARHLPGREWEDATTLDRLLRLLGRLQMLQQPFSEMFSLLLDVLEPSPDLTAPGLLRRLELLHARLDGLQQDPPPSMPQLLQFMSSLADGWAGSPEDLLEVTLLSW